MSKTAGDLKGYFFFFFKQKTAYEMLRSLVGSEMCIRDRVTSHPLPGRSCDWVSEPRPRDHRTRIFQQWGALVEWGGCSHDECGAWTGRQLDVLGDGDSCGVWID
eukprot:TRINITY_DN12594_c0_g1_i4.p3 TRINITY_DN12594_c0_g1~~TRINITY_DN12594_c0_g1_i4.p3  ORF type:complete len:105 (+),score=34.40 TRINITY_DN12594_c0_g1_i4:67-381(+)